MIYIVRYLSSRVVGQNLNLYTIPVSREGKTFPLSSLCGREEMKMHIPNVLVE